MASAMRAVAAPTTRANWKATSSPKILLAATNVSTIVRSWSLAAGTSGPGSGRPAVSSRRCTQCDVHAAALGELAAGDRGPATVHDPRGEDPEVVQVLHEVIDRGAAVEEE